MSDSHGMNQDSLSGVDGLVNWSSLEEAFDCTYLDRFLHDFPSTNEPEREHGTRGSGDERLGFVSSPENEQSFFQDFDYNKEPEISSQLPTTTTDPAQSEIVIAEDCCSFQISFSDLETGETFALAEQEVDACQDNLNEGFWLEEMGNQSQVPEGVNGLFDVGSLCSSSSGSTSSNPGVYEEQRLMLPLFENPSLLESCLSSITSQIPLKAEKLSPSPAVENSRKVKTKEEPWNKSDAEARKERRRLQNRTAAKRCRNRKKECIESMLKAMEKANSEKEHCQKIVVGLKAQIVMLTQELRRHQIHCRLNRNNAPCIDNNNNNNNNNIINNNNTVHPTLSNTRSTVLSSQITNQCFSQKQQLFS